jgi:hypothetical protein
MRKGRTNPVRPFQPILMNRFFPAIIRILLPIYQDVAFMSLDD